MIAVDVNYYFGRGVGCSELEKAKTTLVETLLIEVTLDSTTDMFHLLCCSIFHLWLYTEPPTFLGILYLCH